MIWLMMVLEAGTFAPAVPLNRGEWLSDENYPTRAAGLGKGGSTQADIFVDTSGRPRACYVVRSSGSKDLDGQSCAAAMHRGRFTPAHDESGQPVSGMYRFVTRWQTVEAIDNMLTSLPVRRRVAEPADVTLSVGRLPIGATSATVALRYMVDGTGAITRCAVEQSSGYPALDRAACATMPARYHFAPARDDRGKACAVVRTQSVAFETANGPN